MTRLLLALALTCVCAFTQPSMQLNGAAVTNGSKVNFGNAGVTIPCRTGDGAATGQAGTRGECYFQQDATPGQNYWMAVTTGNPATWARITGGETTTAGRGLVKAGNQFRIDDTEVGLYILSTGSPQGQFGCLKGRDSAQDETGVEYKCVTSGALDGDGNPLKESSVWAVRSGGTGLTDGDKGDVSVSGSGTVISIDNGAVTNGRLANPATTVNGQPCALGGTCTIPTGATTNQNIRELTLPIDGGGSSITGSKKFCKVSTFGGAVTQINVLAETAGSGTFTVTQGSYASYTGFASITTSLASIALSSAAKNQASATGTVTAGNVVCVELTSPSSLTAAAVTLSIAAN